MTDLKFDEKGLIPVIVQDRGTREVLMMAYMNREALEKSMETGLAHYWSRSRQKLWLKGETSGHFQKIRAVKADCDGDTLLIEVEQTGAACHTGHFSCFFREISGEGAEEVSGKVFDEGSADRAKSGILKEIYDVIVDRTLHPKEGSYTNYLFEKGLDKMLKKVGEEAAEVIIAAKNGSRDEVRYEMADLLYHLMVVMVERGLQLDELYDELQGRR